MAVRLKKLRDQSGLSQQQVGELIGCTAGAIGAYEQGINQPPANVLMKLAVIYKSSADFILGIAKENIVDLADLSDYERGQLIEIIRDAVIFLKEQNDALSK